MGTTLSHLDGEVRDYPDDESYETEETDSDIDDDYGVSAWAGESRWRPLTAILGAVVALGAIATAVVINSGDSASTKATVGAPAPRTLTSAPATSKAVAPSKAPPSASPSPPPSMSQLPPETFTTVPPPSVLPGSGPTGTPTAAPPPTGPPPAAALNPRTVVYSVTGTKQLLDLVSIVYTDARGYPQTEFNVSLPWSKMIVLNPGVQTESVVATSFFGRLNCSIIDAAGQTVAASANNANLATCTR
ncbi:MmpS family transport accessory protein [Mycobacterium sp.]|uniref:MmpS family transport accessory protein n=1 Tax=Mycobacterium sp. TaxID=1785 RepID=UPI003C7428B2